MTTHAQGRSCYLWIYDDEVNLKARWVAMTDRFQVWLIEKQLKDSAKSPTKAAAHL